MRSPSLLALAVLLSGVPVLAQTQTPVRVVPIVETQPVLGSGSTIQGAALWVHPKTPASSQLLVADRQAGLLSYELNGAARPVLVVGSLAGVDVQDGFVLDGVSQPLIVVANVTVGLEAYVLDLTTLTAQKIGATIPTGFTPTSVAVYASESGRYYAFAGSEAGTVAQFELTSQTDGGTASGAVRTIEVGGPVAGLAVDDELGVLYVVQQGVGIWQYRAEPTSTEKRVSVDSVSATGLVQPLGGVALYTASNNRGYLLAVNSGTGPVRIYDRAIDAHTYRGRFDVVQDGGIDGVDSPRFVAVSNRSLGSFFPLGVVAVHDGLDTGGSENFKLVDWSTLARSFPTPLEVDTGGPPQPTDGGTDGGVADGGPGTGIGGGPGGGGGGGGGIPNSDGCGCSSASLPGTVLFVLAGALLLSRRRSDV
ncbi:myxosortase-dependent phytase-like phosphatase [Melittangium boletus]|uniref:myxosortase-dependent phytase-like phosphatase n=1 Tax=Melittangium boletus TaxID=83453 RepID=UPI0014760CE1|nr:myxosortase-dependent phytase-like phosphatase [Melittangium boletus]